MLFKLKENEVKTTIQDNASRVENLLETVDDLQEENKKLKEYLQQLASASTASESALAQLKTAYLMLKKIDSSQMDTLKQEVDNLYLEIKSNSVKPNEKLSQSETKSFPKSSVNNNNKNPINHHSSSNQKSDLNSHKSDVHKNEQEVKAVEVEVLDPEEEKKSHYDAVMKLKQLIK